MLQTENIGILPEKLRVGRVGDGYMELLNPRRFVTVYKVKGGFNPRVDDPSTTAGNIGVFENALMQLRFNEQIQIILRKMPIKPDLYVKEFKDMCKEGAPEGYKSHFNDYYAAHLEDFIVNSSISRYETTLLFSIDPDAKLLHESIADGAVRVGGLFSRKVKKMEKAVSTVKELEEVRRRGKAWSQALAVSGLSIHELSEEEIYRLLYEEINQFEFKGNINGFRRAATVSGGSEGMATLREELCSTALSENKKYVQVGDNFCRTLYIKNVPSFEESPHFLSQFLPQPEKYKITLFVRGIDQETAQSTIKGQLKIDLATGSDGALRNYESDANAGKRNSILQDLAQKETALTKFSLFVTLYAKSERELQNVYENFSSRFQGIHAYDGYFQQEALYLSTLPFCFNEVRFHHERLQTTRTVANCWPFFHDTLTEDGGVVIGYTDGGELVRLNPWSIQADNNNIGIFGSQGSGKSVLVQILENKILPANPDIMVIDRSGTYKTTCMAAGGEYIHFGLNTQKTINPFDTVDEAYFTNGTVSQDQEDAILGFITILVLEDWAKSLSGIETAVVLEAIKLTYKAKQAKIQKQYDFILGEIKEDAKSDGREVNPLSVFLLEEKDFKTFPEETPFPLLRDFRQALQKMGKDEDRSAEAKNIAIRFSEILAQFVGTGTYANLSDRPTNIKRNNSFVVFDTTLSSKKEKVKAIIMYTVSTYCFNRARKCQIEGKFPMIVIDEFWDLISFKSGSDFVEILNRTARHLALCTIWATQRIADGVKSDEAKTAFNGAATKIFLKLGDEDKRLCNTLFSFSNKELDIIENLHQVKNVYSQCYLRSSNRSGLVYITLDPLMRWIVSSEKNDKNLRAEYMEFYNPEGTSEGCWETVYHLVDDEAKGVKPEFLRRRNNAIIGNN